MKRTLTATIWLVLCTVGSAQTGADHSGKMPSADFIVTHWRLAVDSPHGPRFRTVHLTFSAKEDGLTGTLNEWVTRNGEYRRSTVRQFDHNEVVLTPNYAEGQDWNNFVRRFDGTELQRLRSQAFAESVMIFGPPASLKAAEVGESPDGQFWTLKFTPPKALPITWYMDKLSSLPVKSILAGPEDLDINTAYADWHRDGLALYPQRVTVSEADKSYSDYRLSGSLVPEKFCK